MIKFAKVIGANTDYPTTQAFVFPKIISADVNPEELFLGIVISASGEDVFSKVRQFAPIIEDAFTQSTSTAGERLNEITTLIKDQLKVVEKLQYLIAVWREGTLYLKSEGNSKAFLLREENLLDLTAQGEGQMVSGHLKRGDKLLLLSPKQIDQENQTESINWDEGFIKKLAQAGTDNLEEEIEGYLQQSQKIDPVSAILIESSMPEEVVNTEQIPQIPDQTIKQSTQRLRQIFFQVLTKLKNLVPEGRKGKITAGAAAIVLVIALTGLFNFLSERSKTHAEFLNYLNIARQKFELAKSLKDSDSQQAQLKLIEAKNDLELALKVDSKDAQGQKLKKEIEDNSASILKVQNITDWPLFLSLDLIKQGFNASRMSFSLDKIALLDEKEKTLVVIGLKDKKTQILAGALQLGSASFASINGSKVYAFSPDKGITLIDLEDGDNPKPQTVAKPDEEWGIISDIVGFSGNVYLLDSTKNQIYKYTPVKSGFSEKITYIKPDQKSDFQGAKKMDIDYSIWVLKSPPEILKFTGGYADHYSVSGLDQNLNELKSMFIAEGDDKDIENGNAYFLDPQNSRIVLLTKRGVYVSQLTGDKFKTATDFVVNEKEKKLYLLEGGKIYQIELK